MRAMVAIATARAKAGDRTVPGQIEGQVLLPGLLETARSIQANGRVHFRHRRQFGLIELLIRRTKRTGRGGDLKPWELQLLGHALSMIRFGVPCNLTWYMHLSEVVDEGLVTELQLRASLGTDAAEVDMLGRLALRPQPPRAKVVWSVGCLGLILAAVLANHTYWFGRAPSVVPAPVLILATIALPPVLLGMWLLGPRRWAAEKVLGRTGLWDRHTQEQESDGGH